MQSNKQETENNLKETSRVETFSDGVFAIAITLLVLELIQMLHPQSGQATLRSYLDHWEPFLAFLIGFFTILVCWINHHHLFIYVKRVDSKLMWVNGFLLLIVTVTPFPTAILATYLQKESSLALAIFGFTYFLMSVAYYCVSSYVYRNRLIAEDSRNFFKGVQLTYGYCIVYTFVAFFICFISIPVAIVLYVLMFSVFAFPKEFATRLLKKPRSQ